MKFWKKTLLAMLLLAMLLPLAGCGSAESTETAQNDAPAEETETVETETEVACDLPDTDWDGRNFHVLGYDDGTYTQFTNFEICVEEANGEVVNDAIFNRNLGIDEQYNATVSQNLLTDIVGSLKSSVMAGDALYDCVFIDMRNIGTAVLQGYLLDMNALPYMDFTKPWWNPDVNAVVSVEDRLFFTTSDFSLRDKSRTYILTYNRDMVNNHTLGDPVALVDEGKWTMDLVRQWTEAVSQDADGDGVMDPLKNDVYGIAMDSYNGFTAFLAGCGEICWTKDDADRYTLNMTGDRTISAIERVTELTCNTDTAFYCNDLNDWSASGNSFRGGYALFMTSFPHSLATLSESCEFDYGVIPFPKYDESQEKYNALADLWCMMFGVPACAGDPAFSAFMLEALSYSSMTTSLPAYYEISCKKKYTYDEDSARMLDLIFDGILYDPAMIYNFNGFYQVLCNTLPSTKKNTFVSLHESRSVSEQKFISKLLDTAAELNQ